MVAGIFLTAGLLVLTSTNAFNVRDGKRSLGSVSCKAQKCTFKAGALDLSATAYGVYEDGLLSTGWDILNITAGHGGGEPDNVDIMFAAGYLEGALTQRRIYLHYQNLADYFRQKMKNDTKLMERVANFLTEQDQYMRMMIEKQAGQSAYWRHASYILAQYDGLVAGYQSQAPAGQELNILAFQTLNGNGDLLDLITALKGGTTPDWRKMTKKQATDFVASHGYCSALIKVLGAYEDIFMSHSSWFIYQATMRIFKHYDFNVRDEDTAATRISFSSYPGFLESLDDFYLLSSKMVMLQTTNNVFNEALFPKVTSQSLLAWHRVRMANMMAHTGQEWGAIFSEQNSGTYNNQYMILDLKKVELKKTLHDGALYVVEQIPGYVEYADVTPILRTGYWPSYNVPFFEKIFNDSGYPEFAKLHGVDFTYQLAPRAKIFRRDAGTVRDMKTMKNIMRYNDYKEDQYSEGNACNAICCRGDLGSIGPVGCYDTKVSNYQMALNFTADIINGPTLGTKLPPFKWTAEYKQSHVGLPPLYDFGFMTTSPMPVPKKSPKEPVLV